ncbi:uncharacterized protein Dana_GF12550 [Drosophila ananassae]|uniref:Gustatory receptor n=1 Tax=Drosophila ananassae TaxID=7217 RepID=B3MFA9_DROAN|nr:putative gustatory receptor 47b isoform X2 [Drosophila ananassae]EDV35583.1 uncharacterized protein Dana_GF12550 [Drosophila ananassae]
MNPDDGFLYCYRYLYGLMFFWGLITFQPRSSRKGGVRSTRLTVSYALLARLFGVAGLITSVSVKLKDPQMASAMFSHLTPLVKVIFSWECLSCSITYVEYCLSLDMQRKRHLELLDSLQEFDRLVSEQFPLVKWNYQRTRMKYFYGTMIVGFCFTSFSLSLIFDTVRCNCGLPSTLLMAFSYTILTSSLGLVGFVHIGIMDFLRLRLRLIQALLQQLYQFKGPDTEKDIHQRIGHLFRMSKRCCDLLKGLNSVFGFAAAAGLFYDFTIMTCFVYVICQKLLSREPWDLEYTFMVLHVSIHTYKVIITSSYGYLLQREKNNCMHLLGNYSKYFPNNEVAARQTEDFQHWRMHNRDSAVVGSTIPLSVSTIYLIYNGMANYVIILVQLLFQQQQQTKDRSTSLARNVEIVGPIGPITHLE